MRRGVPNLSKLVEVGTRELAHQDGITQGPLRPGGRWAGAKIRKFLGGSRLRNARWGVGSMRGGATHLPKPGGDLGIVGVSSDGAGEPRRPFKWKATGGARLCIGRRRGAEFLRPWGVAGDEKCLRSRVGAASSAAEWWTGGLAVPLTQMVWAEAVDS